MIFIYTLGLWLLLPYVFFHLIWRARKQPEYLRHLGERFGFYSITADKTADKPVIWLHAVSVGETRATQNLVSRLRVIYPLHQILLTHATPTGRDTGKQLYNGSVTCVYLPYDYPFAVKKFLRHFQPQLGILMETEIWFNLIRTCRQAGIPLLLLNARMSEKSARGYASVGRLTRNALRQLTVVAAQTTEDAARLTMLGAQNVSTMGNLKFDIDAPPAQLELGKKFRSQFGKERKIFLAASTREGEEALLLDVFKNASVPGLLLVIVPRHPQRFAEVANLLGQYEVVFQRRSQDCAVAAKIQVVLGDSMGEMFAYYACADIAFIGGSLLPYGGQNLIEACAVGAPVLIGPHTYNFSEATRMAIQAGAAHRVADAAEMMTELKRLLDAPQTLAQMRHQGIKFVQANRGATDTSLHFIEDILPSQNG